MIRIQVKMVTPGFADGVFKIRAKGCIAASLYWADTAGPVAGWSAFAFVPVSPTGEAEYKFCGHRAIPYGVTHVFARGILPDFQTVEECLAELPEEYIPPKPDVCRIQGSFSVMSDLHLAKKTWRIRQALNMAESPLILLAGDLVNDGKAEQYDEFLQCIDSSALDKIILPVAGNHDWPVISDRAFQNMPVPYLDFQRKLLKKAEKKGLKIEQSMYGHWAAEVDGIDIVGLSCVTHPRRLTFSKEAEKWLEDHLKDKADAKWHILLCHAPLTGHNPQRRGEEAYLDRNRYLQDIISRYGNVIYISGHTHVSPNYELPCVEYEMGNLYLNDGSVAPTELKGKELYPAEWKDGVFSELRIFDDGIEVMMKSVQSGKAYPRGYYRRWENSFG